MQIKAMAALAQGALLAPWMYETQELGPYDCAVRVKSCGVCHSDIHMIDNDWGFSRYPLVPGHEIAGEVVACGASVIGLKTGTRVGIGWQRSACMQCDECLQGRDNLCERSQGVISHGYGGFADSVVVDSRFCFVLPDGIQTDLAGPLLCGGATVYSALRNAGMTSGMKIGVIGIGGLGHMAVQFAAKLGNEVTVFTTTPDKAGFAAKLGARDAVVTVPGERLKTKETFDILLNTVPVQCDWNAYLRLLNSNGTLTFVGVPPGPASIDINMLLGKQRKITASMIGSRWMIRDMLRIADRYGIEPIVEKFPLAEANAALAKVRDNSIRYRAVLTA